MDKRARALVDELLQKRIHYRATLLSTIEQGKNHVRNMEHQLVQVEKDIAALEKELKDG